MKKKKFLYIIVTDEQIEYTKNIVNHSMKYHRVKNIWGDDKDLTTNYRFTGSIGEVVLADMYGLPRPSKSFGSVDGQDNGQDFIIENYIVDNKTMNRKHNNFKEYWVANISARQLMKNESKTDLYYILNFHMENSKYIITILGCIDKNDVFKKGILYKSGTIRHNNSKSFKFEEDTYEVKIKDLKKPLDNIFLRNNKNLKIKVIENFYTN